MNGTDVNTYSDNAFGLKMLSAYFVCCIFSNALQNIFTMEAKNTKQAIHIAL